MNIIKYLINEEVKLNNIRLFDAQFSNYIGFQEHPLITFSAAYTSYAIYNGHICLPINIIKKNILKIENKRIIKTKILIDILKIYSKWEKIFLNSHSISNGSKYTPLIFENNCLYLYKSWKAEKKIVCFISQNNIVKIDQMHKYSKILNLLFKQEDKIQKIAIATLLTQKIAFIIGGPGTGKTTIIAKFLFIKLKINKKLKIKLITPTGKASQRLRESLNIESSNLFLLKEKNIIHHVCTIHSLLKIQENNQTSFFNRHNPLKVDLLIVDEASMIDLFMMEKIIYAIPKTSSILFFGDTNQIPAIGNGHILKDICSSANNSYSKNFADILKKFINVTISIQKNSTTLNDKIVCLKKNYRFYNNSLLYKFSNAVKKDDYFTIFSIINKKHKDIIFQTINSWKEYQNMLKKITVQYLKYWKLISNKSDIKSIFESFLYYKNLVVLKQGLFGIEGINKNLEINMRKMKLINCDHNNNLHNNLGYHGKPIIITKNNQSLGLFNGEIGIMQLNSSHKLEVSFLKSDINQIQTIPINLIIPNYETAWCITVHKSQGSESNHANLILPIQFYPILTKELIYTSITRSKNTLTVYTKNKIFFKSLKNKTHRYSNITKKIKDLS